MKLQFSLNDNHKLILQVLYSIRNSPNFSVGELESTVEAINAPNLKEFTRSLRIISGKEFNFKLRPLDGRRTAFEKDIEGLEFVGLLELPGGVDFGALVFLTEEGERVAKSLTEGRRVVLRPSPPQRTSIFVACAFGDHEIDQLYNEYLAPACEELGYKPVRIDMSEPSQTITELMMEEINQAACVLGDLTNARPSVYFEIGYAHGLGIPLLLTCREDHHRGKSDNTRIHFDLEQYKISYWSKTSNGKFSWPKGMSPTERLIAIVPSQKRDDEKGTP